MSSDSDSDLPSERNEGAAAVAAATGGHQSDDSAPSHRSASDAEEHPHQRKTPQKSDSDSDASGPSPQKKRVVASSDDEEGDAAAAASAKRTSTTADVFGSDVSSVGANSDKEEGDAARPSQDSDNDSIVGIRLYQDPEEAEEPEEDAAPNIITGEAPQVDVDFAKYAPKFVKFPNFLSVEKKPFDPEFYEEDEEEDALDHEGRSRLKLRVENTIRWRVSQDAQGQEVKESNAKMVRWSDGTMSLYLGNEIFDVQTMPVHDHNHLFIRQGFGLSGQAVFTHRLNFRPHSTDSHTHRKVTLSMADRTRKSGQVKVISSVGSNPDVAKQEAIRKEEEALRAAIRRENQQRKVRDRNRYSNMSSSFIEGRDDSDEESLNAIKKNYQRREAPIIGASDSDDSDGAGGARRLDAAKDDDEEDSDEEFRKKKQQTKKKIVTSDEESP